MSGGLPWRVAWVTGASSGIGAACVARLAQAGVAVAVSARDRTRLEALGVGRANVSVYPLDVTDAGACAGTARQIEAELGPIDLALFSHGAYAPVTLDDIAPETFARLMDVNYRGTVNGLAAVLPAMRGRGRGHIAWVASVSGYRGLPKAAAYGPTKAALISLAESLKPEMDRAGLKLSVVNPGFVATPMTAANDFPMPFLMTPEEAARRTIAGLARGRFEIAYPRRFAAILKLARVLPYALYFPLIRRFVLKP